MMVFIAAETPLPLIPWDKERPAFAVKELHESYDAVRKQFDVPYVYFVLSYQGCGCGFQAKKLGKKERRFAKTSLKSFSEYVAGNMRQGAKKIQLYACWAGGEANEPIKRRQVKPDIFLLPNFCFEEKGEFMQFGAA
jgi:hypothetical protein